MILSGLPNKLPTTHNIATIKILCAYKAYQSYPAIADFYHGITETGKIYALIGNVSGYISLWWDKSCIEEIKSFLSFSYYHGIFTDIESAHLLGLKINEECCVFKAEPPFSKLPHSNESHTARQLMNVLKSGLEIENEDDFIADVSFRTMHDCADYIVTQSGGALFYYCDTAALLNGIAVAEQSRGKGHGTQLINAVKSAVGNRSLYACCNKRNNEFYIKNGFTPIGYAAYCEEE